MLPYARKLYAQGRFRQLAIMHARTLEGGRFSWEMHDGDRVWVVWSGHEVVATYPERPEAGGDGHPFVAARQDRRQDPDDVPTQRALRRLSSLPIPIPGLPSGTDTDDVIDTDDTGGATETGATSEGSNDDPAGPDQRDR